MEKNPKVTILYDKIVESKHSGIVINVGGARSSKSYSISQYLIFEKLIKEHNKNFLITRKTMPSLRLTAYRVFVDLLKDYGLYGKCNHNKSNNTIKYNGNFIVFTSIDDPEKIKSTEFNYIWMEEANEFTYNDFIILKLRLSGGKEIGETNQMLLSLNPTEEQGWVHTKLEIQSGIKIIRSTYHDNPFLSKEYIEMLEGLKEQDESYYKIYVKGEYARLANFVYHNYELIDILPESYDEIIYGLDFGFNNPTALIETGIKDAEIYEQELLYQTHLTNEDLIKELIRLIPDKSNPIYADSAEPARIEEIHRAGFKIYPADKSVKDGIDYVKRQKIHILESSINLVSEKRNYRYREDKNGNVLEDVIKFRDHLMDAERYGLYTHFKRKRRGMGKIYIG